MGIRMLITREYNGTDGNPRIAELTEQDEKTLRMMGWTGDLDGVRYVHTYEGCVLRLGEHNWHDDSDFYATVWDASRNDGKGGPREVEYGTTRGWTYCNNAVVDATEEVRAAYAAWEAAYRAERQAEHAREEARTPYAGKDVRVTGGRKLQKGTIGNVFWRGEDKYKTGRFAKYYRVGITVNGEKFFLSEDDVEVVFEDGPTDQERLNAIAAVIWCNPNLQGNTGAGEIRAKLTEVVEQWREAAPGRCALLQEAVYDIDACRFEKALDLVKQGLG